jgi:hypothetical protein
MDLARDVEQWMSQKALARQPPGEHGVDDFLDLGVELHATWVGTRWQGRHRSRHGVGQETASQPVHRGPVHPKQLPGAHRLGLGHRLGPERAQDTRDGDVPSGRGRLPDVLPGCGVGVHWHQS